MKLIKKILLVALLLVAIAAVIGFLLPGKITLERSLVLKASPDVVFNQINTLKNWEKWSPWFKMDPKQKVNYNEIASGNGASYHWKGEKTMEGTMTITESKASELITTKLEFSGEDQPASSSFILTPEGTGTRVVWNFESESGGNPFGKIFWFTAGKAMIGQSFEQGLKDLNKLTENMKPEAGASIKVDMRAMGEMHYLFIHDSASVATIGEKLGMGYGRIQGVMAKQGLKQSASVFAIYYTESETNWEMDICIPVDKPGKEEGAVKPGLYKGGNMVVASFYGPYEQTPAGHQAAEEYMKKNNKKITGAPWEIYVTDPMVEKDPAKWLTEICYPVE